MRDLAELCPLQVAGELKYHPECFVCLTCGTFIGDGDTYTLVEHSKLYWCESSWAGGGHQAGHTLEPLLRVDPGFDPASRFP